MRLLLSTEKELWMREENTEFVSQRKGLFFLCVLVFYPFLFVSSAAHEHVCQVLHVELAPQLVISDWGQFNMLN